MNTIATSSENATHSLKSQKSRCDFGKCTVVLGIGLQIALKIGRRGEQRSVAAGGLACPALVHFHRSWIAVVDLSTRTSDPTLPRHQPDEL